MQVWAINYGFPEVTASSAAYPAMLFAWSTADVTRYLYFSVLLAGNPVPRALKWLRCVFSITYHLFNLSRVDPLNPRYSLFLVLYPIGIGSEWWLMYRATTVTTNLLISGILYFFLGLYAPGESLTAQMIPNAMSNEIGSVMMYSYMVRQRRKTLSK